MVIAPRPERKCILVFTTFEYKFQENFVKF